MRLTVPFVPIELIVRRRAAGPIRWKIRDAMVAILAVAVLLGLGLHLSGLGERARLFGRLATDFTYRAEQSWRLGAQSIASATALRKSAEADEASARDRLGRGDADGAARDRRSARDRSATAARLEESSGPLTLKANHYHELARKYRAAQGRPIFPVWPDPPEPGP